MDLDHYKKAWNNQPEETNKVSAVDIYKMAHASSSSIVKWIFIIGILEFVVFNSLYFMVDTKESTKIYKDLGLEPTVFYSQIIAYAILIYFLFQFYKNYRNISVVENTKNLLSKIVKTRKTVRNYVIFNLSYLLFIIVILTYKMAAVEFSHFNMKQMSLFIAVMTLASIAVLGVFYLFYQLLYGILLRKLKKNYKEISTLDSLK